MGYLSSIVFDNVPTFRICDGVTTVPMTLTNMTGSNNSNTTYTLQWGNGAAIDFSNSTFQSAQSGNNFSPLLLKYQDVHQVKLLIFI